MTARIRRNAHAIRALANASSAVKRSSISSASKDLIMALSEVAINIIKQTIPLSNIEFKNLLPFKSKMRSLAKNNTSLKTKKRILNQRGGFLRFLLKPLASVLSSILG